MPVAHRMHNNAVLQIHIYMHAPQPKTYKVYAMEIDLRDTLAQNCAHVNTRTQAPAPAPITCKPGAHTLDGHGLGVEHGLLGTSHVHLRLTSHRHGSLQEAVLRRKSLHTPKHTNNESNLYAVPANRPETDY